MNAHNLDIRLLRFRSRREEPPQALALALLEAGRSGEALEVAQLGLLDSEGDPRLLVLEGRAWFEQGNLPEAQASLLRAIKHHPNDKEAYRWLAQVLMKRGEPGRAVQVLDRALEIDPTDKQLTQMRARADRLARIVLEAGAADPEPAPAPKASAPPAVPPPYFGAAKSAAPPARASAEPVRSAPPVPPPPARVSRSAEPVQASAKPYVPEPPTFVPPPPGRSARPMVANDVGDDASRSREPRSASASRSAQPMVASRSAPPLAVPARDGSALASARASAPVHAYDTEPDTVPPAPGKQNELIAALTREEEQDVFGEHMADDAPTHAFEMPEELAAWLESERTNASAPAPEPRSRVAGSEPLRDMLADESTKPRAALETTPRRGFSTDEVRKQEEAARKVEGAPQADLLHDARAERDIDTEVFDAPKSNEPEPPEQVLELLSKQGIFEPAQGAESQWVPEHEAPRAGNRLGKTLAVGWVLALVAAGGGYYGFTRWVEVRKADAQALIASAVAEARDGQYESLLSAERNLRTARERDPKSVEAVEQLLFVHAARALEDGTGEVGPLRSTLARAEEAGAPAALVSAGKALLSAYDQNAPGAQAEAERAVQAAQDDARVLYLVGRLYQRLGRAEAPDLLARATTADPALALAWLAQAELARQAGEQERSVELLTQALGDDQAQLRAELWLIMEASAREAPEVLLERLSALDERVGRAGPADKLLASIVRAGLALQKGDFESARAAVQAGAEVQVQDPELMSLFGERAASVGEHELAYRAANAAMNAAPSVRRYRDAFASVLLKRGDGRAVLAALSGIEDSGPWLLITRARAALLSGSREALNTSKKDLAAYRNTEAGRDDVDAGALLVRTDLHLGANPESLLAAARAQVQKGPDNPQAQLALGEVALAAGKGELALNSLSKAQRLAPEDADVLTLLGRAYRMTGKAAEAERSFEQALKLAPSHTPAREALGSLLLDRGEYDRALKLFGALEREGGGLSASFGAIEARISAGDVEGAQTRLSALSEDVQALPAAQVLKARLAMARGKPSEAVRVLEPLVKQDSEARTADVLALYGDALYAVDRVDPAAGAYEAALELDPGHPEALIGRAMAAIRAEKVEQALELIAQAKVSLETRVRAPRVKATLLLAQGKADILRERFSSAKDALGEAITLSQAPAEAYFWYGETLARTKTPGAAESYTKYLELEPRGYYAERAKKALAPR